jgi:elongation factor P--beta-lysine ligase
MTIEEMRTIDAVKTYKELEDAREQIKRLIAERDTARLQADQNYKLREEFVELLGTDDVEQGVAVVREMKDRIKQLETENDALRADLLLWGEKEVKP